MPYKVLFTASTSRHIRNFHIPYLRWFHQEGWVVHVACGRGQDPIPYADEVIDLPFEKSMNSPHNFTAARHLRSKMRKEHYDLVCTHTALAAFFTRLALLGLRDRSPLVNMVHGYLFDEDTPWHKREVLLWAERLMAPVTDLLLTMNRCDYEIANRYRLGKRVENIPGIGVDFSRVHQSAMPSRATLREQFGIPKDAFVLIYPAEFSGRKNQSVLIHAMTQLPAEVMLILAGDGALFDQCRAMARKLGVDNRVMFPGYLRDMAPWYAAADAAVTASRSEGLPFNLMEAMYAGLPVVASAVKGHVDLIQDGETGLLYPYGNAAACAQQICSLLNSASLCGKLAQQEQEFVKQFSLEHVFPLVIQAYQTLLPQAATMGR